MGYVSSLEGSPGLPSPKEPGFPRGASVKLVKNPERIRVDTSNGSPGVKFKEGAG